VAYYKKLDILYADNARHESDKVTNVGVTWNRDKENFPDTYMVANDIYLRNTAIINVKGSLTKMNPETKDVVLATPIIDMTDDGTIIFDFENTPRLNV